MKETYIVTGGAGFIGTNFVKLLAAQQPEAGIIVLDALTYCGNIKSLVDEIDTGKITFVHGDIADRELVTRLLDEYKPQYIVNFAAESHVDRSLQDSRPFVKTNVEGTLNLLDCAKRQTEAQKVAGVPQTLKKFIQISTDEVYGQLTLDCPDGTAYPEDVRLLLEGHEIGVMYGREAFSETSPLKPSSPYSASKTSADLLALAFFHSFGMPVIVTRCSNNYGPYQHPEKLIPLMINNISQRRKLPVYGRGLNVRDWIYVDDHCRGILAAIERGRAGEVYNFGGYSERRNIDIVNLLIETVAEILPDSLGIDKSLITYVADRPGHDARYAIDARKAMTELGWRPLTNFSDGLRHTVEWYLSHRQWLDDIVSGEYLDYYKKMYSNR